MTKRPMLAVMVCTAALLLKAAVAHGQIQTGEIFGKVTDATVAILPGVLVTIEGPAHIRTQTVVTSDTGAYRFPAIPSGLYRIRFELTGWLPARPKPGAISLPAPLGPAYPLYGGTQCTPQPAGQRLRDPRARAA